MVIGDFNEILSSFEKKGGRLRSTCQMGEFRSVLEDCSLYDVGYNGRWFTWERGRFLSSNLRERLDRGVANPAWLSLFPNFSLEHLNHSFSDHCPLLLNTMGRVLHKISRSSSPFRFEAKWCLDDAFEEVVKRGWKDYHGCLPIKLMQVGHFLQNWSRSRFHEQKGHKLALEKRLYVLLDKDPSDEILGEIMEVQLGLNFEADKEEVYWAQRARLNWLQYGDRNSSFFHRVAVAHHNRNRIHRFEDGLGQWTTRAEEMLSVAVKYFEKLFTASDSGSDDQVLGLVEERITRNMNDVLLKPFTKDDI